MSLRRPNGPGCAAEEASVRPWDWQATAVCNTASSLLVCPRAALTAMAGAAREQQTLEWMRSVPLLSMCTEATLGQLLR